MWVGTWQDMEAKADALVVKMLMGKLLTEVLQKDFQTPKIPKLINSFPYFCER